MRFSIKVLEKSGAVAVELPNGKTAKPGSSFTTEDRDWVNARKHWHYLEISEVVAPIVTGVTIPKKETPKKEVSKKSSKNK